MHVHVNSGVRVVVAGALGGQRAGGRRYELAVASASASATMGALHGGHCPWMGAALALLLRPTVLHATQREHGEAAHGLC